jgi:hypothetical protein
VKPDERQVEQPQLERVVFDLAVLLRDEEPLNLRVHVAALLVLHGQGTGRGDALDRG